MHVDATGLTVMDLAANHGWIGVRLHLKASYTVPVDVAAFEIALGKDRKTKQHFQSTSTDVLMLRYTYMYYRQHRLD